MGKSGMEEGRAGRSIELARVASSPFPPLCQLQIHSQMSNAPNEQMDKHALPFVSTTEEGIEAYPGK